MFNPEFSNTVILGNGTFPSHPIPLKILNNAGFIICCDGAADELVEQGIIPSIIIGDMDSISKENYIRFKEIIVQNSDQETNDQTKAVNWAIQNGFSEVIILGATGKREDHTIGNISLLCKYAEKIKICSVSNTGIFTPVLKSTRFESFVGQQISVFSLNPETEISSENLKYPLNELKLTSWWMGTLNESFDESFSINFEKGELVIFQLF